MANGNGRPQVGEAAKVQTGDPNVGDNQVVDTTIAEVIEPNAGDQSWAVIVELDGMRVNVENRDGVWTDTTIAAG